MKTLKSIIVAALCAVGITAFAEPVEYLDWDDAQKKMTNAVCEVYEVVTAETATFAAGKTYVVTNDVINASDPLGITVEGTVANPTRLILCDGAKLTVTGQSAAETAGLNVSNGTAIVICGQKDGTGELVATGGSAAAGIGGNASQDGGTVTIYGGSVTALGKDGAAGIGGGMNNTDTGTVTFGGTGFSVVTGKTATVTAPIAQDDYEADHSAAYVHIEPMVVAQFVKGGKVVAEFKTADEAVAALDDAQYADIEEFRIGLTADTEFDFGGRTNRVVILNVGAGTNTLKNVLLDCAGDYVVTGMVGTVVFGEGKKTYKRWVGGEYKVTLEEGDYLISREKSRASDRPELIWTARQEAPAAQPAPAVLDWTDTTLTLAVSNGCDYALVTSGSAETNWISMVGTDNTYPFARSAGTDYLCLRRYSITPSNIVSAATAYSMRIPAGTEGDPWLVGAENPEDVTAWTNGTEFVVSGAGTVPDLSKLAGKVTVEKLTIKDATATVASRTASGSSGMRRRTSLRASRRRAYRSR